MFNRIESQSAHTTQQFSNILNRTVSSDNSSIAKVSFSSSVNKKLQSFATLLSAMQSQSSSLTKSLQEDKYQLKIRSTNLTKTVNQLQANLKVSIKQQNQIITTFIEQQSKQRFKKITDVTEQLTEKYTELNNKIKVARERIERLQNTMGYYNAKETHL